MRRTASYNGTRCVIIITKKSLAPWTQLNRKGNESKIGVSHRTCGPSITRYNGHRSTSIRALEQNVGSQTIQPPPVLVIYRSPRQPRAVTYSKAALAPPHTKQFSAVHMNCPYPLINSPLDCLLKAPKEVAPRKVKKVAFLLQFLFSLRKY